MITPRRPFSPAWIAAISLSAGLALGAAGTRALSRAEPPSSARPSPRASEASSAAQASPEEAGAMASASASAAAADSAAGADSAEGAEQRAEAGDLAALKVLEGLDDRRRTAEQSVAVARGRAVLARADVASLLAAVTRQPELAHDRATLARFFDLTEREPVALDALAAVARLPGPEAIDLLHASWRRHRQTITGLLARDLLRSEDCRARASEALRVTIELEELIEARPATEARAERRCKAIRELLDRVVEVGDRRSESPLGELNSRQGCALGKEDCYPCLREGDLLKRAKEAVKARETPTPWALRR